MMWIRDALGQHQFNPSRHRTCCSQKDSDQRTVASCETVLVVLVTLRHASKQYEHV